MKYNPFNGIKIGWLDFSGVTSEVETDGVRCRLNWQPEGSDFLAETDAGKFTLTITKTPRGYRFHTSAVLKQAVKNLTFCPLTFPALTVDHLLAGGAKMGGTRLIRFPRPAGGEFSACHLAALTRDDATVLFTSPLRQIRPNRLTGTGVGRLLVDWRWRFEVQHSNNTVLDFDDLTVECGNGLEMLEEYGRENAGTESAFPVRPEYGWNSWDYYRWTVNEDEVMKNAEFIAGDPVLRQYVRRIIVDDGWEYCYGEWEANSNFPSGMKKLAERLSAMGFTPGLWVAPAIVEPHCRHAQLNYDMMGMSEGGQACLCYHCMQRHGMVLDPTVPDSRKFLTGTFDRLAGYGYRYFKLDFLAAVLNAPRFHDESVSRSQIPRLLLEAAADGVKGRAVLLGCNYPYAGGPGLVEAVRIAADIHSRWGSIKANAASIAGMFWANRRLWLNDPDFALCRGLDTSDDPDLNRLKCSLIFVEPQMDYFFAGADVTPAVTTLAEQEVWLSLELMAAGVINLSDKLPELNALGLKLARQIVAAEPGETGVPLDLFTSELPARWLQKTATGRRLLLINWIDETATVSVNWPQLGGKPAQLRNFWKETAEIPVDVTELAPHSCRLWEF